MRNLACASIAFAVVMTVDAIIDLDLGGVVGFGFVTIMALMYASEEWERRRG